MAATIKIVVSSSASGSALRDAQRDIRDMDNTARGAGGGFSALKGVGVAALTAVATAAVGATVAVGKFVADSVGAAATFESSINGLKAVTGNALEQAGFSLEDVSQKALQLGMDTQFSAQQAVEAMTELAKGGVPIQDVMNGATDATLNLAAATGMELAPAAEILAKQLGVWSETGVDAAQITDLLASAANASTVDVDDLALGLANAGGTAKTMGMEYTDLVQSMALIAPNFSSASDAGTSFKTFMSRLIPTTDSAKDAMIALNLATEDGKSKFFDAQGQFIGMEAAAQLLQEATAGLSEEEKLLAFNTIFGADAIRSATAIANAGAPGFNAMGQAMADSGGAAAAAAAKNQGFAFAMEQLKGSVETLQIVLGTMLLPILTDFLNNYLTPGVNKVMAFVQAFAAARQSGVELSVSWGASFNAIRTNVETALNAVWTVVQLVVEQIMVFWQANGAEIMAFTQETWATITEIVSLATELYALYISTVFNAIAEFIRTHGTEIQEVLRIAWETIKTIVTVALALIKGIIQTVLAVLKGDWQGAWDAIKTMTSAVWEALKALFKLNLDLISVLFKSTWENIKMFFQGILDGMVGWVIQTFQGIINAINDFMGTARSAAGGVADAIVDGIASGISGGAGKIISAAKNAAQAALDAAMDALGISSPSKLFMDIGMQSAEGMAMGITAGAPMVASAGANMAMAGASGARTYDQRKSVNYSPTIHNHGSSSDALDLRSAISLAGV